MEDLQNDLVFLLPHSGVFKKTAANAKVRILYDGSVKPTNGWSLNDNLMTGPGSLKDEIDWWPFNTLPPQEDIPERRKIALTIVRKDTEMPLLTKFFSFIKLQRLAAYLLRFIRNARSRGKGRIVQKYLPDNELKQMYDFVLKLD